MRAVSEASARSSVVRRASAATRASTICLDQCQARWVKARNRGAQLYQWAMLWRAFRGRAGTPGAGMLSQLARKVDEWRQQDREDIT